MLSKRLVKCLFLVAVAGCSEPAEIHGGLSTSAEAPASRAPTKPSQKSLAIVRRADGIQELNLRDHFTHRVVVKREQDGGLHRHCGATSSASADEGAAQ